MDFFKTGSKIGGSVLVLLAILEPPFIAVPDGEFPFFEDESEGPCEKPPLAASAPRRGLDQKAASLWSQKLAPAAPAVKHKTIELR
jgi:hypothetical protein